MSSHSAELDAKVVSLIADLAMARDSSASLERDNSELNARVSELEKSRANLDSELKTAQARLLSAAATVVPSASGGRLDAAVAAAGSADKKFVLEERLKRLETQLSEEKSVRSRAEAALSDKDRELSMLTVDYHKAMFKVSLLQLYEHQSISE